MGSRSCCCYFCGAQQRTFFGSGSTTNRIRMMTKPNFYHKHQCFGCCCCRFFDCFFFVSFCCCCYFHHEIRNMRQNEESGHRNRNNWCFDYCEEMGFLPCLVVEGSLPMLVLVKATCTVVAASVASISYSL